MTSCLSCIEIFIRSLSRPSLSQSGPPLPKHASATGIDSVKALDIPSGVDEEFCLSPIVQYCCRLHQTALADSPQLTLPPAFGQAYVGETFSCTLCANNELLGGTDRIINGLKIGADMQTPSGTVPLELTPEDDNSVNRQLGPGESLQRIVRFDLREEGNHVLAVSLSYSETTLSDGKAASSGRVRTFRKLYQFAAQPCLSVRTKVSDFPTAEPSSGTDPSSKPTRFALEAQLENMADGAILLEKVTFNTKAPFLSTSLNWDAGSQDGERKEAPTLVPRDVVQVAFLIEEQPQAKVAVPQREVKDGRTVLGQLSIRWRTAMGDSGFLTTGWLMTKKR